MFEAGQAGHRLAACAVRAHAVLDVLGKARQQAEVRIDHLERWHCFVTGVALGRPANDGCELGRVGVTPAPRGSHPDGNAML